MSFNPDDFKEVEKKVKFLLGESQEALFKQLEEFTKTHSVIDIKQTTNKMMIVFYAE